MGDIVNEIFLTPHEFKLFVLFYFHRDKAISRRQLLDQVWGHGVHVLDRTIDKHVSSLRHKILGRIDIIPVRGKGYMMMVNTNLMHRADPAHNQLGMQPVEALIV